MKPSFFECHTCKCVTFSDLQNDLTLPFRGPCAQNEKRANIKNEMWWSCDDDDDDDEEKAFETRWSVKPIHIHRIIINFNFKVFIHCTHKHTDCLLR